MEALVNHIRKSKEPELVRLRKILLDESKGRNMTFEELRKFNPLIFIKGGSESTTQKKSKQEVDLLNSLMRDHLVKDYFKDLA